MTLFRKSRWQPFRSADRTYANDGFDERSYALANPDVRHLSSQQLARHWRQHGLQEARLGSGISPYSGRRPWKGILPAAGLNVAFYGPVGASSGLGTAARGYVSALSSLGIDLEVIDTTASLYPQQSGTIASPSAAPDIIILHQNPDSLGNLFRLCDRRILDGVYTIGIWVWEIMAFRPEWIEAFGAVDEIWAPSPFVAEAIEAAAPAGMCVRTVPHVVEARNPASGYTRSDFGIPDDAFAFLCIFDASSAVERKNPVAVLEAFADAFKNDPAAFLVMKYHSSGEDAAKVAEMRRAHAAPNILFSDVLMSGEEVAAIMQLTDCLVSAHRAEGFGLNIAEAMAVGKPVIATAYSGNLAFCDEANSMLVSAQLREVEQGTRHYPVGSIWGEPDHDQLVSGMRRLVDDRSFARALGERAAQSVGRDLSRGRVARLIEHAFEEARGRGEQVAERWEQRRRLAWRHPGARGAEGFAGGAWPTFSLILPVRDTSAELLAECVDCIVAQTYPYWELCICDDASANSKTSAYLNNLRGSDQRLRIRRFPEPRGVAAAIDAAVELSTGEFLAFVDDHDLIERAALARCAAAIRANASSAVACYGPPRIVRKKDFLDRKAAPGAAAG